MKVFQEKKTIVDQAKIEKDYQIGNIQEAMALKASDIRALIVRILRNRPIFSCVKDVLAGLILKDINVISRGKPRKEFTQKVNQSIRYLERNNVVETYKSKNVRVRLIIGTE